MERVPEIMKRGTLMKRLDLPVTYVLYADLRELNRLSM